ncbi:glycosyltransferase [Pseudomonas danubii]|uniref:glycosyltransferase n=1 Tax=Pseudomonas danubii TaxID=2497146 RepID=UPI003857CE7E
MADVLMLCHDQHLDRRVVAQAATLIERGHFVRLLALSFDAETTHEVTAEGIQLIRIGLNHIVPENPTYKGYMARQYKLNDLLNWGANRYPGQLGAFQRIFNYGSRLNWNLYKVLLLVRYRNRVLHDPLPFRQAFVKHGAEFQSDLVQVHDLPALEAGTELAALWDVPLVYDAHELYPEQKTFSRAQRKICSKAEAHHIKKATLIFAVNHSIGEEMSRRYNIAKPITLLNAIDPPLEFDPLARYDLLREKLGLSSQRRILLFQGGFAPYRNLENLIDAMALVKTKDVDLVMMGFGDFGNLLKAKAESLKLLGNRIHFLSAVPQNELLQHSASADIGIIPYPHVDLNSYYCTPNKLFEFIQAGLPILSNDSPELNRFVRDNNFGYSYKMENSKKIAEAIDHAFSSSNLSTWQSKIKSKREELTWSKQSDEYANSISTVLPSCTLETKRVIGAV